MFDNWTIGRRLIVGFGLAGLTLLVIASVSYRTTEALIENNGLVNHTRLIRTGLSNLISELKDAETGQRGYIITAAESYLAPYQSATIAIHTLFQDVKNLTADAPNQQRRLAALAPLIEAKLAELKATID